MTDLPSGIPALIEKKVQEERKMIAEWIMSESEPEKHPELADVLTWFADKIERGEYRKGEGE